MEKHYIRICPDYDVLYSDAEGCCADAYGDEIANDDITLGPCFSIVVPGIEEWLRRYENATDFVETTTEPSFDWATWHYEGLCFAKAIWEELPRCYTLFYDPPFEDRSHTLSCMEINEKVDEIIDQLCQKASHAKQPLSFKNHVDFHVLCKDCIMSLLFQTGKLKVEVPLSSYHLIGIRKWLDRIIEGTEKCIFLQILDYQLYFFMQTIGHHLDMGQFWIKRNDKATFEAYVSVSEFVKGMLLALSKVPQ